MKEVRQSIIGLLRLCSLIGTASLTLARENPAVFIAKVLERLRNAGVPGFDKVSEAYSRLEIGSTREVSLLRDRGDLSEAVRCGQEGSRADRYIADRVSGELAQLTGEIVSSAPQSAQSNRPRALFVLTNSLPYTQSGYTIRSHKTLSALQEAGVAVAAVTRLGYPVLVGKFPWNGSQVVQGVTYKALLPARYPKSIAERDALSVDMIVDEAQAFGATVLHTTTDYKNALITSRAAHILGIPWVYEVRGELENTWLSRKPKELQGNLEKSEFYTLARRQEANAMNRAAAVITLSNLGKGNLVARGVDQYKIHIVSNAIDRALFKLKFSKRGLRAELGLDPDATIVGSVTSVVDYEGIEYFLESLQQLPGVEGLIVGDGTDRPRLERLANELSLAKRVKFVGRKPEQDIWKWYAVLDAFVVPRKNTKVCRNVTPIKALTAQALGIPVVASDLPAIGEITGGLETYVEPEDSIALARGIKAALAREDSTAAVEWAAAHTWDENSKRILALYRSLESASGGKES